MKKVFTLFILCLLGITASATTVTFDATEDLGSGGPTAGPFSINKDCVTVFVSNGIANGAHYRVYKNQYMTIYSECGEIVSIVIECVGTDDNQYGPGCFTTDVPTYSSEQNIGSWTGRSQSVTFTAAKAQVRITKIIVTYDDGYLSKPEITPAGGYFSEPVEVSISCPNEGAQIYYTTNGSDPTEASTLYTAPFTVSSDLTVKAVAILDGEMSEVTSATFNFIEIGEIGGLGEIDESHIDEYFSCRYDATVIWQRNKYLYLKDQTGYGLVYGDVGQNYNQGDVIPRGWFGQIDYYSCNPELTFPSNFKTAINNVPVEAEEITFAQLNQAHWGHYVVVRDVTIDLDRRVLRDADGNEIPFYGSLGITWPIDLTQSYNVYGIVGAYKPVEGDCIYQLLPVKCEGQDPIPDFTLCDLSLLESGTEFTSHSELVVLWHQSPRLYVKERSTDCYAIIYGNVEQSYAQGDVIPAGWGGTVTFYSGEPELCAPFTGFQPATEHIEVMPEVITPNEVDHEHFSMYVEMSNVTISGLNGRNFTVTDENGNTCSGYNQFNVDLQEGFYSSLLGIVGSYGKTNTIYQLLPLPSLHFEPQVRCFEDVLQYPENTPVQFDVPVTVVYQNGMYSYLKDECGQVALFYGLNGPFSNGDRIIGIVKWTKYGEIIEMLPVGDWQLVDHGSKVMPIVISIEEISVDLIHQFVKFEDVIIVTDENNQSYIEDKNGSRLPIFNKFGIDLTYPDVQDRSRDLNDDGEVNIADLNCLIDLILSGNISYGWRHPNGEFSTTLDVSGFLYMFRGIIELYPVEIVPHGWNKYIIGDINNDNEVNLADVNALIGIILSD